jgi:hypothetical protein
MAADSRTILFSIKLLCFLFEFMLLLLLMLLLLSLLLFNIAFGPVDDLALDECLENIII